MSFYLKLKNPPKGSSFIYFDYLEEIPMGGWYMNANKWKYAQEFNTKEEAEEYKKEWDDCDSFVVVDRIIEKYGNNA